MSDTTARAKEQIEDMMWRGVTEFNLNQLEDIVIPENEFREHLFSLAPTFGLVFSQRVDGWPTTYKFTKTKISRPIAK
jgi:hypothetical protein